MSKGKTTKVLEPVNDLDQFGPIVTTTKVTTKKEDLRDYQKTPEVNGLIEKYGDKSKAIRALHQEGYKNGQIADMLRIRFQHVRNVLNQKTK
jgi:predicted xylose isomerase-like sugar epimerase